MASPTVKITHSRMTTIETHYIPASNHFPGRIVADAGMGRRIRISAPMNAQNDREAHDEAVYRLCAQMGWDGELHAGGTERGFRYVFLDK